MVRANIKINKTEQSTTERKPPTFKTLKAFYTYLKRLPIKSQEGKHFKKGKKEYFLSMNLNELKAMHSTLKGTCEKLKASYELPVYDEPNSKQAKVKAKDFIRKLKLKQKQRLLDLYKGEQETAGFKQVNIGYTIKDGEKVLNYNSGAKEKIDSIHFLIRRTCQKLGNDSELEINNFKTFFLSNEFNFKNSRAKSGECSKISKNIKIKFLAEKYFSSFNKKGILNLPKLKHSLNGYIIGDLVNTTDFIAEMYINANGNYKTVQSKPNVFEGVLYIL